MSACGARRSWFPDGFPAATRGSRRTNFATQAKGFSVQVEDELAGDGLAYTRAGNFSLNRDGEIVLANDSGRRLQPSIQVPETQR